VGTSKTTRKRVRQTETRTVRNKAARSSMRTSIRHVREEVATGNQESADKALAEAIPVISKTASKGLIHKNNAARKISRLTAQVCKLHVKGSAS